MNKINQKQQKDTMMVSTFTGASDQHQGTNQLLSWQTLPVCSRTAPQFLLQTIGVQNSSRVELVADNKGAHGR